MANPNPPPPPVPESKYDPVMCEIFVEMSSRGCSRIEFCAKVGLGSYDTFLRYQKEHPEFREAVRRGLMLCQSWWESKGRDNVDNPSFNKTLWYMNMKNRFRNSDVKWSDAKEVKHSGKVDLSGQTDEELDNKIRSLSSGDSD